MKEQVWVTGSIEILVDTTMEREPGNWTTKDSDDAENALFEHALIWAKQQLESSNRDDGLWADVRVTVDRVETRGGEKVATWEEVQV